MEVSKVNDMIYKEFKFMPNQTLIIHTFISKTQVDEQV